MIVVANWGQIKNVLGQADWALAPLAFLGSAVSYLFVGLSLVVICRAFSIFLKAGDLIGIGFVTNVLDAMLPAVGLPGLSVRVMLMQRRGLGTSEAVAASLFRSYFSNFVFILFLPFAFIYVLLSHHLTASQVLAMSIVIGLVTTFLVISTLAVFSTRWRHVLFGWLVRALRLVTRRDLGQAIGGFEKTFGNGVDLLKTRPAVLAQTIVVLAVAWVGAAATMYACFPALHVSLPFAAVLAGFFFSRTVGVITFLPAGAGTQDASLVGFFVLFGLPLADAVLIALLFRVVYYFAPFAASLVFYRRLLRAPAAQRG